MIINSSHLINIFFIELLKLGFFEILNFEFDIIGINDNKLISNPIHALNQEFDETVINIPRSSVIKNNIFVELFIIRIERITL